MRLDPSLAVDSGLRWGREWTCTANACLTKLLACINLFFFKHMRVIWTKRFLKGSNSWHLRFTTGRVWIYCRRRCSRYHYIASLHLFGPNTEQTQQGYRDESQEFRVCLGDPAIYSGRAFGLIELYMRHCVTLISFLFGWLCMYISYWHIHRHIHTCIAYRFTMTNDLQCI